MVGRVYNAFCKDPDSWRNWLVFVESESRSRKVGDMAVTITWPTFRHDFARTNSVSPEIIPSTPGAGITLRSITRSTEEVVYDYRGDENAFGLYRNNTEIPLSALGVWAEYSVTDVGLLVSVCEDSEFWSSRLSFGLSGWQFPTGAYWSDDTIQMQAMRVVSGESGNTIWEYRAPVRAFEQYDPDDDGGGDDGGGGAD